MDLQLSTFCLEDEFASLHSRALGMMLYSIAPNDRIPAFYQYSFVSCSQFRRAFYESQRST